MSRHEEVVKAIGNRARLGTVTDNDAMRLITSGRRAERDVEKIERVYDEVLQDIDEIKREMHGRRGKSAGTSLDADVQYVTAMMRKHFHGLTPLKTGMAGAMAGLAAGGLYHGVKEARNRGYSAKDPFTGGWANAKHYTSAGAQRVKAGAQQTWNAMKTNVYNPKAALGKQWENVRAWKPTGTFLSTRPEMAARLAEAEAKAAAKSKDTAAATAVLGTEEAKAKARRMRMRRKRKATASRSRSRSRSAAAKPVKRRASTKKRAASKKRVTKRRAPAKKAKRPSVSNRRRV